MIKSAPVGELSKSIWLWSTPQNCCQWSKFLTLHSFFNSKLYFLSNLVFEVFWLTHNLPQSRCQFHLIRFSYILLSAQTPLGAIVSSTTSNLPHWHFLFISQHYYRFGLNTCHLLIWEMFWPLTWRWFENVISITLLYHCMSCRSLWTVSQVLVMSHAWCPQKMKK